MSQSTFGPQFFLTSIGLACLLNKQPLPSFSKKSTRGLKQERKISCVFSRNKSSELCATVGYNGTNFPY
jgi:hypothetical protein